MGYNDSVNPWFSSGLFVYLVKRTTAECGGLAKKKTISTKVLLDLTGVGPPLCATTGSLCCHQKVVKVIDLVFP